MTDWYPNSSDKAVDMFRLHDEALMRKIKIEKNDEIIKCPICSGTGCEKPDIVAGILTFGISYALESIDPEPCYYCDGEGYIVVERE